MDIPAPAAVLADILRLKLGITLSAGQEDLLPGLVLEIREALGGVFPKLRPFDEAWFMHENKAVSREVREVEIRLSQNCIPYVEYAFTGGLKGREEDVFATKQELLDSL